MSAVISNTDPGYLREMADMEHDIVRTPAQADAVAAPVTVDPLNTIDRLWLQIIREREVLRHEHEEIAALQDNANHREAVIGQLLGQIDAVLDGIKKAVRS